MKIFFQASLFIDMKFKKVRCECSSKFILNKAYANYSQHFSDAVRAELLDVSEVSHCFSPLWLSIWFYAFIAKYEVISLQFLLKINLWLHFQPCCFSLGFAAFILSKLSS